MHFLPPSHMPAVSVAVQVEYKCDEAVYEYCFVNAMRLRQPRGQSFDVVRRIRHFERLILLEEALRGSPTHDLCVSCVQISGRSPAAKLGRQPRRHVPGTRISFLDASS